MSLSGDIISDMELDASIDAIGEIAGSIDLDGAGTTPTITASATVSPDPGIPACNVVKTGTDEYPNFTFNFSGLKGDQGVQGVPGQNGQNGADGITPTITATASVSNTSGIPIVNVTKTGSETAPNFDFAFSNLKGERGEKGEKGEKGDRGYPGQNGTYPNITATASANQTIGIPSVVVTKTGSEDAPNFDFAFSNIKGEQGIQGLNGRDGTDGVTPIVSATASVDDVVGIPNVVITRSGSATNPNFDFAFHNIKGQQGNPGQGVPSGGSTGQVLAKQSSTDYDADWETLVVPSTAAEISFDNTGTGMTATDVQDAVTELKSNLTWKEASSFNQAYTNATNEVLVIISNNNPALGTTFTFPKAYLSSLSHSKYFTNGYHYNSSTYALMQIYINIADMSGTCSAYSNGVAVQGAEAKFYYR
jgi:hypothetical protein